jgi:hypothetical protein
MDASELAEFWRYVPRSLGQGKCWPWQGNWKRKETVTRFYERPWFKDESAYRIMHCLEIGPIPYEWVVHHTCENSGCVNPEHLLAMGKEDHDGLQNCSRLVRENSERLAKQSYALYLFFYQKRHELGEKNEARCRSKAAADLRWALDWIETEQRKTWHPLKAQKDPLVEFRVELIRVGEKWRFQILPGLQERVSQHGPKASAL